MRRPTPPKGLGTALLALLAYALITAGVALWSIPAALVTAGALLRADLLGFLSWRGFAHGSPDGTAAPVVGR